MQFALTRRSALLSNVPVVRLEGPESVTRAMRASLSIQSLASAEARSVRSNSASIATFGDPRSVMSASRLTSSIDGRESVKTLSARKLIAMSAFRVGSGVDVTVVLLAITMTCSSRSANWIFSAEWTTVKSVSSTR